MILRMVSMRQDLPFSMRSIVRGDTPALRASSALLIKSCSLIIFRELRANFFTSLLVKRISVSTRHLCDHLPSGLRAVGISATKLAPYCPFSGAADLTLIPYDPQGQKTKLRLKAYRLSITFGTFHHFQVILSSYLY